MRYQEKPYVDQSVGTIADMMLRSGRLQADQQTRLAEIAANLRLQLGQASAGATLGSGQAWAGGMGSLANLANIYAQAKAQQPTSQPAPPPPLGAFGGGASGGGGVGAPSASAGLAVPPRAALTATPANPSQALYDAWRVR